MFIINSEDRNEFVEKCLSLCLSFIRTSPSRTFHKTIRDRLLIDNDGKPVNSLYITLQANNDFYSQTKELQRRGLPLLSQSLKTLPEFLPCHKGDHRYYYYHLHRLFYHYFTIIIIIILSPPITSASSSSIIIIIIDLSSSIVINIIII